jgi:hypothetical protein
MDESILARFDEDKQGRIYNITLNIPNSEIITGEYIDKRGNVVRIKPDDGSPMPIQLSMIKEVSLVSEVDNSGPILKGGKRKGSKSKSHNKRRRKSNTKRRKSNTRRRKSNTRRKSNNKRSLFSVVSKKHSQKVLVDNQYKQFGNIIPGLREM